MVIAAKLAASMVIYAKLAANMAVQAILGAFPAALGSMSMLVGLLALLCCNLAVAVEITDQRCLQIRRQLFYFKALAC